MPKVSVIILNFNGQEYLSQFLPTLIRHTPDAEIVVADNNSTDGSIKLLKTFANQLKIIKLEENHGYAGGYNEALSQVESEYYMLINSDVEVTENWLAPLVQFLDENSSYVAVQPKILDFYQRDTFEYAGAAGGFIDLLGYPYCRGRIFDTIEKDTGQYDSIIDVDWCSGACFLIRSETFHAHNGFESSYFAHMEEIDLCWRILNQGGKLACIPSSKVYHVGGGTLSKTSPFKTYLNFKNNLKTLQRNLPRVTLFFVLPLRIVLDWLAGFKLAKDQSLSHLKSVIKAQIDFIFSMKSTSCSLKKRKNTFRGKKILLAEYYIFNRSTYHQINNTK